MTTCPISIRRCPIARPDANPDEIPNPHVQPIANSDRHVVNNTLVNASSNYPPGTTEDNVPVEGLININTAPWRVLSALPMSDDPATTRSLRRRLFIIVM